MSLSTVYDKLEDIQKESSTKLKVKKLKEYLNDALFLKVIKMALDNTKMYKVTLLPRYKDILIRHTVDEVFDFLTKLSEQQGVTQEDKFYLAELASIDKKTYDIVQRICKKDLRCGVSGKLVNKARPGTINLVPYMRCSTSKKMDNIQFPAIIQEKADGMFANVMINKKSQIKIISRNGKQVYGLYHLKKLIWTKIHNNPDFLNRVYTGELLVVQNGKVLPRKTGNGILYSHMQKGAKEGNYIVTFRCWDCLSLEEFYDGYCQEIYLIRFSYCKKFVKSIESELDVNIILTKNVTNINEAHEFYTLMREKGKEGAVLKNTYAEWKNATSTDMIKMKNVQDAELRIVGWEYGKKGTKYDQYLGALLCESEDGILKVSVGSGFSDEQRKFNWDTCIGKIVTVLYESIIKDKTKDTYSLYLPRFDEVREDRTKADYFDEIKRR